MSKKLLIAMHVLLMCIVFSSCRIFKPEQFCADHYPPQIIDSSKSIVTYCWDTVPVYVPYNELLFDTTGVIPESILFHKVEKKGGLTSTIDIKKGRLIFKCSEDSLKSVIAYQKEIITNSNFNTEIFTRPCSLEHRTGWDYFCRWFTLISLITIGLYLILKFIKAYFTLRV